MVPWGTESESGRISVVLSSQNIDQTVAVYWSQALGIGLVLARASPKGDFRCSMSVRILVLGAVLSILAAAFMFALWVLDFISDAYFRQGLGKMLAIIAIATVAAVLIDAILRLLRRN